MATQSKAQFLTDIHNQLKKRYKVAAEPSPAKMTILEAAVFGACHENATQEQAAEALTRFKANYFDWNEVRVSSLEEIQGTLDGLDHAEERALRIRRFLRQLFEKTYSFTLDALAKKPLKESVKVLQEYEIFSSDFILATVVQQSLGGHAIPISDDDRRALERLGVADGETDTPSLRSTVERAIPKTRGFEFSQLIEALTSDTCVEGIPDCPRCELKKVCPTAQIRKDGPPAAKKSAATKGAKEDPKPTATTSSAKPVPKLKPVESELAPPKATAKGKAGKPKP